MDDRVEGALSRLLTSQHVMIRQPAQDLFFPLFLGSESGMPSDKLCGYLQGWIPILHTHL